MRFTTPLALLLLLILPYFFWLAWPRRRTRRGRREQIRAQISLALRSLIMLLLALSLAGTELVRATDELAVVFLVDASDSITPEQAAQAEEFVRAAVADMPASDRAAVVVFGDNALVERPMSSLDDVTTFTSAPRRLQTDLAEAIRLGLALFPSGSARRMVVIGDGVATTGNTEEAARLASAADVPIDYLFLSRQMETAEALLSDVSAPSRVVEGESFTINAAAQSTVNTPATLRVVAGGEIVHEETVALRPGNNNFAVTLRATAQTFARYQVQLEPAQDTYYQNNTLATFTEIVGPPQVLLVAHTAPAPEGEAPATDESPALREALTAAGLSVTTVDAGVFPTDLTELSNYEAVVLVNVNAKRLTPRQMAALQQYVRDLGGGLVAVGGPQSYGMGGYFRTPLEETLPVEMQIKDQERFPSVSIVLVIDRSGSMGAQEGGLTKIQLAAEGAVRVVELLNPNDEITVIPVDTRPDAVIGPFLAGERDTAISQIRQIGAGGGGIYIRTGLEAAAEALAGSANQVKHIVVLADGADSEQKEGAPELISSLGEENVTVSMVSIGGGPDTPWLERMAKLGDGRFHFTDQAANLPQIFTQETTLIQRNYLIEERFFPTQEAISPILAGIEAVPPLYGYVGASPKDTAQVVLETHMGDPLLATWQYGLGRAVAWTSDATGRWAGDWVRWAGFPAFWAQTARWAMGPSQDDAVETAVQLQNGAATLTVEARDANDAYLNGLAMTANVVGPTGEVAPLQLSQVAPGRYSAEFSPAEEGAYLIRVSGEGGDNEGEPGVAHTGGWVLAYSPEYEQIEASSRLLARAAEITGGRALETAVPEAVFSHTLPSEADTRPVWPWLTLLAVVLLPLDVAARRLVVTRRDLERLWAATGGRWQKTPASVPARTEQVSRLFAAKKRAGARAETPPPPTEAERPAAPEQAQPPTPSPSSPTQEAGATTPKPAPSSPAEQETLAARLLQKRKQQEEDTE